MNKPEFNRYLYGELAKKENFDNWHGIRSENLKEHLVDPYPVTVFAHEDGSDPEEMWIVLYEYPGEEKSFLIGYCPTSEEWCLIEKLGDGRYLCDTVGDGSLAEALSNM
jgi:hypothetical protein